MKSAKIDFNFGVTLESVTLTNGKKLNIIDNTLPEDYWEQSNIRQIL